MISNATPIRYAHLTIKETAAELMIPDGSFSSDHFLSSGYMCKNIFEVIQGI